MSLAETTQNVSSTMSLEEQIARLQALLEASRQVHSTIAVDEVMLQTARVLVRELEMEGAGFVSAETGGVLASYGALPETLPESCHRFDLLAKDGAVLATLVVVNGREGCGLSIYEQDFIEGLVLQAAVALENALFHERDVQWARMQQDLEAARGIQQSLLPRKMPLIPGVSVAAKTVACFEVGGDYLDVVQLTDGSHLFVVADVAGKGMASALLVTSFRAAFRALAAQPISLEEMVTRVGQHHWEDGQESRRRYVTAIFARFDPGGGWLEIVNAGHNPGALVDPDGGIRMVEASGTPLGLLPGMTYGTERFPFPPGARLLLYTDGLTEVFHGEEEFGPERLADAFRELHTRDAAESLEAIWARLREFSTGGPQTDDMTALTVIHQPHRHGQSGHFEEARADA